MNYKFDDNGNDAVINNTGSVVKRKGPVIIILSCIAVSGVMARAMAEPPALEEIIVKAARIEQPLQQTSWSVSVVDRDDIQTGKQQLALDEALTRVPGVFMQNRYNFAQDLRIAIRGFGTRAAFGIRGIRIYVDGIPATLPDGQGGVDSIDIGSAGNIEVLRGPSSSLYGAAAGGVINISTEHGPDEPFVEGRFSFGDYGFEKTQVKTGGQAGPLNYLMNLSHMSLDGYREQSETENTLFNSRLNYEIDEHSSLTAIINAVDSPEANDPGAITELQARTRPRTARDVNLSFDAGEALSQQQAGFVYRNSFAPGHEIILRNYYVWRSFENKLPFQAGGVVAFDRFYLGGGVQYNWNGSLLGRRNRFSTGFDIDSQGDDRRRFDNNTGIKGPLNFQQMENVDSIGIFMQDIYQLYDQLALTLGLRYDDAGFDVADRFLADGDDSGSISFDEFSPSVALLWSPTASVNIYGRIATSFETPTTTEFANPSGAGGFNTALKPQTATSYEIGMKGNLYDNIRYDIALYTMDVKGELLPFEVAAFTDKDFFRNAGKSTRHGLETSLTAGLTPDVTATLAYTWSDFAFDRYATPSGTFDGNEIPGIPEHQFFAEIAYKHPKGFYLYWDIQAVSGYYANDANSVSNDPYVVSGLRAGYDGVFGKWKLGPFLGLNNLFDESYNGNVRLNSFGGRYFEPAPGFNIYGGVSVGYSF
jgi:iron complex outermembrane receptor protein